MIPATYYLLPATYDLLQGTCISNQICRLRFVFDDFQVIQRFYHLADHGTRHLPTGSPAGSGKPGLGILGLQVKTGTYQRQGRGRRLLK